MPDLNARLFPLVQEAAAARLAFAEAQEAHSATEAALANARERLGQAKRALDREAALAVNDELIRRTGLSSDWKGGLVPADAAEAASPAEAAA